jgi:hypothetical protein
VTRVGGPVTLPLMKERPVCLAILAPDGAPVDKLEPRLGRGASTGSPAGLHELLFGSVLNRRLHRTGPLAAEYVDQVVDTVLQSRDRNLDTGYPTCGVR